MTVIQGIILGIVQGLSEFLPISSSGHLVLVQKIFGIETGALTFDVAVHLATLIAVFAVLWKDIIDIIKKPFGKLPLLVVVGTIPTILIGIAFKDLFEKLFASGVTLGFEFILTGLILWYAESIRSKNKGIDRTTYLDATVVGLAQGIAILPAVSRSGLTIAGALFRGLNREFAARFSFLMSIPAILGAAVLDGYDIIKHGNIQSQIGLPLIAGMIVAAISGYFAIKFMFKILAKGSMKIFSYYVFAIGALIILAQIFGWGNFGRLF